MVDEACAEAGRRPGHACSAPASRPAGPSSCATAWSKWPRPTSAAASPGPARGLPNDWQTALLEAPLRAALRRSCGWRTTASPRWRPSAAGARLQGFDHCAYVTWSTGIGVGLCVDGRVLRGKNGNAGHAGHMFVSDNDDALCGCGNVGDVEALVAGNARRAALRRRRGHAAAARAKAGDAGGHGDGRRVVPGAGPRALQPDRHAGPAAHQPGRQRVLEQQGLPAAAACRRRSRASCPRSPPAASWCARGWRTGWATTRRWRCWC